MLLIGWGSALAMPIVALAVRRLEAASEEELENHNVLGRKKDLGVQDLENHNILGKIGSWGLGI